MGNGAKPKERLADRECVAVDQDLVNSATARLAAYRWMLATVAIARIVGECTVRRRYGRIFLFDAASHFRDQGFLQRERGREHVLRVDVLVFKMLPDRRVEHSRIAHHPLPVWVLEPGKFVGEDNAVPACREWGSRPRSCARLDGRYTIGHTSSGTVVHRGGRPHFKDNGQRGRLT